MSAVPLPREVAGGPAPARGASPVLCTLVLCDLVDSTALVERLGDQAGAALMRRHDRLARDLMHRHGGREIDKTDGFLVLFERPIQGVAFALDYQRELRELGKEQGFALRARAGIHVGDVVIWENSAADVNQGAKPVEVEGLVKPVAARLAGLAMPGQTLASGVAASLAQRAHDELGERAATARWINHGRYRFKGVPEPLPVYEIGELGSAPMRAPAWSSKAHREVPWWRRPATVVAEALLLAVAVGSAVWWVFRPPPAIAFAERDWVVMGDLHNTTNDAQFDDSLQTALRVGLEQSRFVNVVPELTVRQGLARMERQPNAPIDRQIGAELAQREHARALILPTLIAGRRLRLSAEIVDPQSLRTVATRSVDAEGPADLVAATDKLVSQLRETFGESVAQIEQNSMPLEKVTTANLEALKAYTVAVHAITSGDYDQSFSLLKRATELDPEFALAWARMGANYLGLGKEAQAKESIDHALSLGARLSQRERTYMQALRATVDHGAASVSAWRVYADIYPDDAAGAHNAGMYGFFLLNECNKGGAYLQRSANSTHPLHAFSIYVSAYCSLLAGEPGKTETLFKQAYGAGVGKRWLGMADYYLATDRPDDAIAWIDSAAKDRNPPLLVDAWQRRLAILADAGRLSAARATAAQGLEKAAANKDQRAQWVLRAGDAAVQAELDPTAARREIDARLGEWLRNDNLDSDARQPFDTRVQVAYWAWLSARWPGEKQKAKALALLRKDLDAAEHPRYAQLAAAVEARYRVADGDAKGALALLQGTEVPNALWLYRLVKAQALDAAGQDAEAIAAYRALVEERSDAVGEWVDDWSTLPLVMLEWNTAYVRWAELAAKTDAAEGDRIARRYLQHLKTGDAAAPLRRRAEALVRDTAPSAPTTKA